MKKLNNKGFTLIELLAVIVILAIVMGISANSVLNSINSSRKSSLLSTAQSAANTLNTWGAEDMLITDASKQHLGTDFVQYFQVTNKNVWVCIGFAGIGSKNAAVGGNNAAGIPVLKNAGVPAAGLTLEKALNLSATDLIINAADNSTASATVAKGKLTHSSATVNPPCSAIRYNSGTGSYEVMLVAKSGGKYFASNDAYHYAYSTAPEAYKLPTT